MKIGDLRHRISIEQLTRVSDGSGGNTETWSELVTVWAKIKPSHGAEFFDGERIKNIITHNITIRFNKEVKPKMRIIFKSRRFDIHSIVDIEEKNCWLLLRCEEAMT